MRSSVLHIANRFHWQELGPLLLLLLLFFLFFFFSPLLLGGTTEYYERKEFYVILVRMILNISENILASFYWREYSWQKIWRWWGKMLFTLNIWCLANILCSTHFRVKRQNHPRCKCFFQVSTLDYMLNSYLMFYSG